MYRCQLCKREHSISASSPSPLPFLSLRPVYLTSSSPDFDDSFKRDKAGYTLEESEEQKWGTLAVLECRGCEVTAWDCKVRSPFFSSLLLLPLRA